jgi:hypothetical protein
MRLEERKGLIVAILRLANLSGAKLPVQQPGDQQLHHVRETIWRASFANGTKALRGVQGARAGEVFVRRNGARVNPAWHTDLKE